jgi:hypothetical protein
MEADRLPQGIQESINIFMSHSSLKLQSNQKWKLGEDWKSTENENMNLEGN